MVRYESRLTAVVLENSADKGVASLPATKEYLPHHQQHSSELFIHVVSNHSVGESRLGSYLRPQGRVPAGEYPPVKFIGLLRCQHEGYMCKALPVNVTVR